MARNLKFSLWDAFFFSIMVGAGESYLPAFALNQGFSETLTGLFSTVPLAIAAIIQLLTPMGLRKVGSVRRWVVCATALQAISFLPLVFWNELGFKAPIFMFLLSAVYWGTSFAAGAVWNRWMADIVTHEQSSGFFARRLRVTQYGILLGLLVAGFSLQYKVGFGLFSSAFSFIFLIAFFARASSSYFLWKKTDAETKIEDQLGIFQLCKQLLHRPYERSLLIFLFLFSIAIFVSSPFVNPFLLGQLKMSFQPYTFTLIALFLGKIIGYTITHRYLKNWSTEKTLFLGAFGIAPMPALWIICTVPWSAALLQTSSGIFWGIYESALTLILFRRVASESKVALLSLINFVQCVAILLGSLLGATILKLYGEAFAGYVIVFAVSSMLRLLVSWGYSFYWVGWPIPSRFVSKTANEMRGKV